MSQQEAYTTDEYAVVFAQARDAEETMFNDAVLPVLDEALPNGYDTVDMRDEVEREITRLEAASGTGQRVVQHSLPALHLLHGDMPRGMASYPSYFVVQEAGGRDAVQMGSYAAALDHVFKYAHVQDDAVQDAIDTAADVWEQESIVDGTYTTEYGDTVDVGTVKYL